MHARAQRRVVTVSAAAPPGRLVQTPATLGEDSAFQNAARHFGVRQHWPLNLVVCPLTEQIVWSCLLDSKTYQDR